MSRSATIFGATSLWGVVELGTRPVATGRVRCLWITILTGRYGLAVDFLWCNHGGRDRAGQPRWQSPSDIGRLAGPREREPADAMSAQSEATTPRDAPLSMICYRSRMTTQPKRGRPTKHTLPDPIPDTLPPRPSRGLTRRLVTQGCNSHSFQGGLRCDAMKV